MKALSVKQPFAYLLGDGLKSLEVRSWPTEHRGELLICASASPKNFFWHDETSKVERLLHAGCMIAVVNVMDCRPMTKGDAEAACSPFVKGAFVWATEPVRWCRPVPVIGRLQLFDVPDSSIKLLDKDYDKEWLFDHPCPQGDIKFKDGVTPIMR